MHDISWMHFFILALASYRLTHLIVFDEIVSFIRSPFLNVSYEQDHNGQVIRHVEIKGTGVRYWIGSLLSCYWCVGLWSSITIVLLYMFFPVLFPLWLILAIAGAAAIIETKV